MRQPAEIGPVLFSNSSPTYANLTPIASAGGDDGGGLSTAGIVALVVAGVGGLGILGFTLIGIGLTLLVFVLTGWLGA